MHKANLNRAYRQRVSEQRPGLTIAQGCRKLCRASIERLSTQGKHYYYIYINNSPFALQRAHKLNFRRVP